MSFIIIWDTCASPEYYADLHNSLALPAYFRVRYEYTKKRFDHESLQVIESFIKNNNSIINIVIFYGEVSGYEKGAGLPPANKLIEKVVPYRLGRIVGATCLENTKNDLDSKIVYDIELLGYPNTHKFEELRYKFTEVVGENLPFKYWHTFVDSADLWNALSTDGEVGNRDNWRSVVELLQGTQFKDDSFWALDIPHSTNKRTTGFQVIRSKNSLSSTVLCICDESDVYFDIEYISPRYKANSGSKARSIKVVKTDNIKTNKNEISLRPYSKHDIHLRGISDTYFKGELAAVDFHTITEVDDFPIGPNFRIDVSIHKNWFKLLFGVLSGMISIAGIAVVSKIPIYVENAEKMKVLDFCSVGIVSGGIAVSSLLFLISGYLLRKEFKLK
jgi:hypothetical protein